MVLGAVCLLLFFAANLRASSPVPFRKVPTRPVAVPRIKKPPLELKDIQLDGKKRVVVILESAGGKPSMAVLKGYSVRVEVKGSKPLTINLDTPGHGAVVETGGRRIRCIPGLRVRRTVRVKAELLRQGAVVSFMTRVLNPLGGVARRGGSKSGVVSVVPSVRETREIPRVEMPDLVVADFNVVESYATRGVLAFFPVVIRIRNQGTARAQARSEGRRIAAGGFRRCGTSAPGKRGGASAHPDRPRKSWPGDDHQCGGTGCAGGN